MVRINIEQCGTAREYVSMEIQNSLKMLRGKSWRSVLIATAACVAVAAGTGEAVAGTKVGVLTCKAGASVGLIIVKDEKLNCVFKPNTGAEEHYVGQMTDIGIELGATGATAILWGVIAATNDYAPGSLAGVYGGASADASVVLGVGANALFGGSEKSLALQPLSVQGQAGLDVGLGISGLTLKQTD
jgi:hypothetical protein